MQKTAYTLVYSGKIPYTVETNRLGRTHRIKLTDVLLYLYEKNAVRNRTALILLR